MPSLWLQPHRVPCIWPVGALLVEPAHHALPGRGPDRQPAAFPSFQVGRRLSTNRGDHVRQRRLAVPSAARNSPGAVLGRPPSEARVRHGQHLQLRAGRRAELQPQPLRRRDDHKERHCLSQRKAVETQLTRQRQCLSHEGSESGRQMQCLGHEGTRRAVGKQGSGSVLPWPPGCPVR